ncbi:16S rRNA processing protein RimM [Alkalicaulis satelles]|uniref:Ribosome maturation factor RimM n=2 Tax=Alkalicaulis satelles TaxID=2609175 RepID=A0A5M6ZJP0_9PROT|nr:16S rRNA processing protein RimM [Alkalicaulis satelles]
MPSSAPPDLVVIAALAGAHGVRGEAKIKPFGDAGAACSYGPFLDASGQVILTPVKAKPGPSGVLIVTVREGLTREQLMAMKGALLHVPRAALPAPDEDEFYHADLIGLEARDEDGAPIGNVRAVQDFGAGDVLEIAGPGGVIYAAFTREAVPEVSVKEGWLRVRLPDVLDAGDQDQAGGEG